MSETSRFIRPILEFLFPQATETTLIFYHSLIRKAAHLVEYAVLAFLAVRAFRPLTAFKHPGFAYAASLTLVCAIAVLDELNQSFIGTRTGSIADVMLDITGGLAATAVIVLLNRVRSS